METAAFGSARSLWQTVRDREARRSAWDTWKLRRAFDVAVRTNFYHKLSVLLAGSVPLADALVKMYDIESVDGARPDAPTARIVDMCLAEGREGELMSDRLSPFIGTIERSVLAAAEASNADDLAAAFRQAVRSMSWQGRLRKVINGELAKIRLALAATAALLLAWSFSFAPDLSKLVDMSTVDGVPGLMFDLATVVRWGLLPLLAVGFVAYRFIAWSVPNTARLSKRSAWLNKLPPFSLYGVVQCIQYVDNLATFYSAKVDPSEALRIMRDTGDPWLAIRLNAIRDAVLEGSSIGDAMAESGVDFPDHESRTFIAAVTEHSADSQEDKDGPDTKRQSDPLTEFADNWLDVSEERVKRAAMWATGAVMALIAAFGLAVVATLFTVMQAGTAGIAS